MPKALIPVFLIMIRLPSLRCPEWPQVDAKLRQIDGLRIEKT